MSLSYLPALLAAALPFGSGTFMLIMVMSATVSSVIIVFNVLSLKHRGMSRASVYSVVLLLAGCLLSLTSMGLSYESGSLDLLENMPGIAGLILAVASAAVAVVSLVQFGGRHRVRHGRKRAIGSLVGSLVFFLCFAAVVHRARHPVVRLPPKTRVELLPETDAYGHPTPPPAVVRAAAAPAPAAPEATPRAQLFPNVVVPNQ